MPDDRPTRDAAPQPARRGFTFAALAGAAAFGASAGRANARAAQTIEPKARLTAEDRLDMLTIANRFTTALEDGDVDTVANLFAHDGVIDHPAGFGKGRDGVRRFFHAFLSFSRGVRLNSVNQIVTANDDGTASMRSALQVIGVDSGHRPGAVIPALVGHALIHDRLKRENGRWVIANRTVEEVIMTAAEQPDPAERARWAKKAIERGPAHPS